MRGRSAEENRSSTYKLSSYSWNPTIVVIGGRSCLSERLWPFRTSEVVISCHEHSKRGGNCVRGANAAFVNGCKRSTALFLLLEQLA